MTNQIRDVLILIGVATAGIATHRLLERIWEENARRPAPKNPADPGVSWGEALLWAASAGVLAGLAKTVTRRGLAGFASDPH